MIRFSIFTGVFIILWLVAGLFCLIFSCVPVAYFWDKSLKTGGWCLNEYALFHSFTSLNIVTDIIVLVLPIPYILKLQMRTARKVAIIGILLLGSL